MPYGKKSGALARRMQPVEAGMERPAGAPSIGVLVHDIARLRRQMFDAEMSPLGLTRSQCWVLAHLERHPDRVAQSELAAALDVGKVTLGGLVDRLETRGLVRREPCAYDRRVKYVRLTPRGRKAVSSTNVIRPMVDDYMMRGLSPALREQVTAALDLMRTNLLDVRRSRGSASARARRRARA
jgi:MarR family transcriptional regulator, transcriptional regulator for hemolysin